MIGALQKSVLINSEFEKSLKLHPKVVLLGVQK
jgi:hypothetical protein